MCQDGPHQVVEQLRLRRDVAIRVGVHVPGGELVERGRLFIREMQHVAVRVLAGLVEHLLEYVRQVLGIAYRVVLFSSHGEIHAVILNTSSVTRNPEHTCLAPQSCPRASMSLRVSSPTTISPS